MPNPANTSASLSVELAGRPVARIGYGVMQLAERSSDLPPEQAVAVLRTAIELGVDHLDTAQFYGDGEANRLVRAALAPYPAGLVLATKVGAARAPDGALVAAQRPDELREQVEQNLATLGVDRLDVVNLRRVDRGPGIVAEGAQLVPIDDQLATLVALREEGKIGGVGLSNVDHDQLTHALPAGVVCVQNRYSLVDRSSEPVLDVCREHGVAWVPFFPLGGAFAGHPKVVEQPAVRSVAVRLDVTPAQVGLAWLLAGYGRTLLIPGTGSLDHLRENVAAASVRLDAEALRDLDAAP